MPFAAATPRATFARVPTRRCDPPQAIDVSQCWGRALNKPSHIVCRSGRASGQLRGSEPIFGYRDVLRRKASIVPAGPRAITWQRRRCAPAGLLVEQAIAPIRHRRDQQAPRTVIGAAITLLPQRILQQRGCRPADTRKSHPACGRFTVFAVRHGTTTVVPFQCNFLNGISRPTPPCRSRRPWSASRSIPALPRTRSRLSL